MNYSICATWMLIWLCLLSPSASASFLDSSFFGSARDYSCSASYYWPATLSSENETDRGGTGKGRGMIWRQAAVIKISSDIRLLLSEFQVIDRSRKEERDGCE